MKLVLPILAILLVACSSDPTAPVEQPASVAKALVNSGTVSGYTVELYTDSVATVGYTPLYLRILRNGSVVRDMHATIMPDMDMGMMHHSCPVEQPDTSAPDSTGLLRCAAIFTMPSSTTWTIGITLHDHEADSIAALRLAIPVVDGYGVRTAASANGVKYVFTLLAAPWKVGMNDVRFAVHSTVDGFSFAPVANAQLFFEPSMPSMGHGSMGNVQPSHVGNGWYAGRVNFTMTGDWRIDLTVNPLDGALYTARYDFLVLR